MSLQITGLTTLPEIKPGDDLSRLIREAADREERRLDERTILIVAQKVVSKCEGALVDLRTVQPSALSLRWAQQWNKDARAVELILHQSKRVVRMDRGVIIAETHHGFIAANAGVDQSNIPGNDIAAVLPTFPDESARRLRTELNCGVVIVSDTFGRPWREGQVNVAIGVSGLDAILDLRGSQDSNGRMLSATVLAQADELAAAGGLVMPKAGGVPIALIEGYAFQSAEGGSRALIRPPEMDMFR